MKCLPEKKLVEYSKIGLVHMSSATTFAHFNFFSFLLHPQEREKCLPTKQPTECRPLWCTPTLYSTCGGCLMCTHMYTYILGAYSRAQGMNSG